MKRFIIKYFYKRWGRWERFQYHMFTNGDHFHVLHVLPTSAICGAVVFTADIPDKGSCYRRPWTCHISEVIPRFRVTNPHQSLWKHVSKCFTHCKTGFPENSWFWGTGSFHEIVLFSFAETRAALVVRLLFGIAHIVVHACLLYGAWKVRTVYCVILWWSHCCFGSHTL